MNFPSFTGLPGHLRRVFHSLSKMRHSTRQVYANLDACMYNCTMHMYVYICCSSCPLSSSRQIRWALADKDRLDATRFLTIWVTCNNEPTPTHQLVLTQCLHLLVSLLEDFPQPPRYSDTSWRISHSCLYVFTLGTLSMDLALIRFNCAFFLIPRVYIYSRMRLFTVHN